MGAGLVASLARPGGNVTGLSGLAPELNTKRLEILKDAVPKLARVGLLRWRRQQQSRLQLKELRPAALALKLKLEEIETQPDAKGLESAFQTAKQKQVGAIMTTASRRFFAERKRIVELAVKYRLPAIYFQKEFVDEGGLMSYGADYDDLYRRAAVYVDKILKGAKPADLPVQQATKFEFIINLKAAKQIGLTIPGRVLERANQVIRSDVSREATGMSRRTNFMNKIRGRKHLVPGTMLALCACVPPTRSSRQKDPADRIHLRNRQRSPILGPYVEALRQGLRDLGYVEGKNIRDRVSLR